MLSDGGNFRQKKKNSILSNVSPLGRKGSLSPKAASSSLLSEFVLCVRKKEEEKWGWEGDTHSILCSANGCTPYTSDSRDLSSLSLCLLCALSKKVGKVYFTGCLKISYANPFVLQASPTPSRTVPSPTRPSLRSTWTASPGTTAGSCRRSS